MAGDIRLSRQGEAAILNLDLGSSAATVATAIVEGVRQAQRDAAVAALVLVGGPRGFTVGADIGGFGRGAAGAGLSEAVNALEGARKPIVAAVHGMVCGEGLELVLACSWRLAVPSARFGAPGARAAGRLSRLIGVTAARRLIDGRAALSAADALCCGLIDSLASEGELVAEAIAFARRVALDLPRQRVGEPAAWSRTQKA